MDIDEEVSECSGRSESPDRWPRELTAGLEPETIEKWEAACVAWERDGFPKQKPNPYHTEGAGNVSMLNHG